MTSQKNEPCETRTAAGKTGLRSPLISLPALALAAAFLATSSLALPGSAVAQGRYYYSEPYYGGPYYGSRRMLLDEPPPRIIAPPRQKARALPPPANKKAAKFTTASARKPQGPLTVVISIAKQHLTLYDANGVFAESPVSTGMAGHSTPMGIFSIIQKNRHHRSNIYSNAPMPFMQRITWSGVALHEGKLPGYPASHGCIRLPAAFAAQLWGWTRMGARVVIVPNETVVPQEISNPQLVARIVIPEPETSKIEGGTVEAELQLIRDVAPAPFARAGVRTADSGSRVAAPEVKYRTLTPDEVARRIDAMASGRPVDDLTVRSDAAPTPAVLELRQSVTPDSSSAAADTLKLAKAAVADAAQDAGKDASRVTPPAPGRIVPAIAPGVKPAVTEAQRKRTGQIAAFVSRKEGKLYVRQAFEPIFEIPIEITDADKPIGTHLFTARTEASDAQALRWTAMTMPELPPRRVEARNAGRSKIVSDAATSPQVVSNASEALARIKFPKEALDRISALMGTGGSLIISDKGLGGETGRGTEFIVELR